MPRPTLKLATLVALTVAVAACSGASAEVGGTSQQVSGVIGADDAVQMLEDRDDLRIIDVRTPAEFEAGHLAAAQLLDVQDRGFVENLEALDRDAAYVVYCRTGNRSAHAVSIMRDLGFTELYDAGGLAELAAAGAPVAEGR